MRRRVITPLVALALGVSACSKPGTPHLNHAVTVLNRGNGAEISSLDPDNVTGNWEAYVIGDCLVGLTTEGPDGNPVPGAATSWETSPDGKTWTFHIRRHVWSDGVPVTAQDFVFAWRRILDPARAAPYAYYLWLVKNARLVNTGKLPPAALGITAKDDRTLVIQLEQPAPYLPEWLMHQTTYPVPRHAVLAKGNAWARVANYVANGPYIPQEWIPNDHVTLVRNPRFYDAAHVRIAKVNYFATTDSNAALKRMQSGELDTQEPLPLSEIDWLRKNMPKALDVRPYLGNSYILFNFDRAAFKDRRLREAMSLVYNREAVVKNVLKVGVPAYSFVPPGTANYPAGASVDFKSLPYAERVARARALMVEMGYGPDHHFRTTFLTTTNPDSKRTAATFQSMMRQIYIDLDIVQTDAAVFYNTLSLHQFDTAGSAWIGDFDDASTFLDLLRTGSGNNYGSYSNPKFDALYAKAQQQTDLAERGKLMEEAEQIALTDDAVIPVRFLVTLDLVQPYVRGWRTSTPNLRNFHRTRWLWIDPKALGK